MRILTTGAVLAALAVPCVVGAEPAWDYEVALEVQGIFDDNAPLADETATDPDSQILISVSPSGRVEGALRFFDLSAAYQLTFINYQDAEALTNSPDLIHDGQVRVALTYWEGVDVQVGDRFDAVGLEYALPHDEPQNITHRNTAFARLGLDYDVRRAVILQAGYEADRVDYQREDVAPSYLAHGPRVGAARDLTRQIRVGLGYAFRLTDYDEGGPAAAQSGDLTAHQAFLEVVYDGAPWSSVRARGGFAQLDADLLADPITTFDANVDLKLDPTPYLGFVVGARYGATADLAGNPGVVQEARLAASIVPMGKLRILADVSYGQLTIEVADALTPGQTLDESRQYLRGMAAIEYDWLRWISTRAGFVHHQFAGPSDADIMVNRGFVGIVARYD